MVSVELMIAGVAVLASGNLFLGARTLILIGRLIEKAEQHERRIVKLETARRPHVQVF